MDLTKVILLTFVDKIIGLVTTRPQRWSLWAKVQGPTVVHGKKIFVWVIQPVLLQVYSFQRRFSNVQNPFTRKTTSPAPSFDPHSSLQLFRRWIDLLSRYILKFLHLGGHLLTVCIHKLSAVAESAKNLCMIQMRREQKTISFSSAYTFNVAYKRNRCAIRQNVGADRAYSSFKSFSIKAFKNFLFYLLLIKY